MEVFSGMCGEEAWANALREAERITQGLATQLSRRGQSESFQFLSLRMTSDNGANL